MESSVERATVLLAQAKVDKESAMKSGQTRVEFGDRRYVRTLEMFKKELVAIKDMDEAETAKYLAEYECSMRPRRTMPKTTRARPAVLELKTIRSPINGVVVERLLTSGEFTKQAPILRLAQIDPLRVEVIVPVALFGRIKVGHSAEVYPEAAAGRHVGREGHRRRSRDRCRERHVRCAPRAAQPRSEAARRAQVPGEIRRGQRRPLAAI